MAVQGTARRKLTYEDYAQIPDDGRRHEIIDGVHYVSPSPTRTHQVLVRRLIVKLTLFAEEHQLGEIFPAPFDVLLSSHDIVQPDILFVSTARLAIVTEANVKGAPDLAVEILSDSTRRRDENLKRDRYEQLEVQEYWILDGSRKTVCILRRTQGSGFGTATELTAASGQVLTTPLLPGLELPLREIFS